MLRPGEGEPLAQRDSDGVSRPLCTETPPQLCLPDPLGLPNASPSPSKGVPIRRDIRWCVVCWTGAHPKIPRWHAGPQLCHVPSLWWEARGTLREVLVGTWGLALRWPEATHCHHTRVCVWDGGRAQWGRGDGGVPAGQVGRSTALGQTLLARTAPSAWTAPSAAPPGSAPCRPRAEEASASNSCGCCFPSPRAGHRLHLFQWLSQARAHLSPGPWVSGGWAAGLCPLLPPLPSVTSRCALQTAGPCGSDAPSVPRLSRSAVGMLGFAVLPSPASRLQLPDLFLPSPPRVCVRWHPASPTLCAGEPSSRAEPAGGRPGCSRP